MYTEYTGGTLQEIANGHHLFHHLVANQEELKQFDAEEMEETGLFDFVSELCYGTINFVHVTSPENAEVIYNNGFIVPQDYIPDLGVGVYCVEPDCYEGINNLTVYLEDLLCYEDDETDVQVGVIEGVFTGLYTRCIYGDGRYGYIVLKNIESIQFTNCDTMSLDYFSTCF